MFIVRNLLVFAILAMSASTLAFAYDLNDDAAEPNSQAPKEAKHGKGIFRHRKIASATKNAEQNSETATSADSTEKASAPQ